MKRRSRTDRWGTLAFVIPIVLILAFIAYAVLNTTVFQNGTLTIEAQTSSTYYPAKYLNVTVSVAGKTGVTPFTVSLSPGTYTVVFSGQRYFQSAPNKVVNLTGGGHSFVVGTYAPIPLHVSVQQDKFNVSGVQVLHGVTPLVWVNPSSSYEVLNSTLTGTLVIPPGQSYTYVFQNPGTYVFSIPASTNSRLVVRAN